MLDEIFSWTNLTVRIPCNKCRRCLFNFKDLRGGASWTMVLRRRRPLFQSKRNYSHEIEKFMIFLFENNEQLPLRYIALNIQELLATFTFLQCVYLSYSICILI